MAVYDGTDGRSVGELVKDIAAGTQTLVSQEIKLAKLEMTQSVSKAGVAAVLLAVGAVMGLVGLIFAGWTITLLLALVLPVWLGALITMGIFFIVAGILALVGYSKLKTMNPAPDQTIQTLKEDQEWLKQQIK